MAHLSLGRAARISVMGARTLWWGGCAWDSFALPHLLPGESEMLVATRCPACQRPHAWNVSSRRPPDGEQVAHFLVPAARMWDDVVRTCGHQRLFCSEGCVDAWLADTGYPRGYVMDLGTLWRLAAHWYDGRLERGYVRREPSQAAAYLRGVGLAGPSGGCDWPYATSAGARRRGGGPCRSDRAGNWSEFDRGGHFAAMEIPDLLAGDVREFFRPCARTPGARRGRPGSPARFRRR